MYITPTKRRNNANLIQAINFEGGKFMNLSQLHNPYSRGGKYIVTENTESVFCSNGIYKTIEEAKEKLNWMKEGYRKDHRLISEIYL